MICATCPFCFTASGFLNDDALRVTCPACLRTFDPAEPLPEQAATPSDAVKLDDLLAPEDDGEPPELALDRDSDDEAEPDADFEEGV